METVANEWVGRQEIRDMPSQDQIRRFYEQWAQAVYTFCKLQLGDDLLAERVTEETFLDYIQGELPLAAEGLPFELLRSTVAACLESDEGRGGGTLSSDLERALLALPADERATFILHTVLGVNLASVGLLMGASHHQACQTWLRALMGLRDRLVSRQKTGEGGDHPSLVLAGNWNESRIPRC